jgi:heme-degrading monooxygenase HmoA
VAVIEITTFRLAPHADEHAFLDADRRVQTEVVPNHPGFLRRTTARGDDGAWLVVVLWRSADEADASRRVAEDHPVTRQFNELLDGTSIRTARYSTLD